MKLMLCAAIGTPHWMDGRSYRPGPSKQQPRSAWAIHHSLLRSWHQGGASDLREWFYAALEARSMLLAFADVTMACLLDRPASCRCTALRHQCRPTRLYRSFLLRVRPTRVPFCGSSVEQQSAGLRRVQDVTNPKCAYEETCFYPAHKEMPKAEQIATALLQLKNNPALFDGWAARNGAFKADGQVFTRAE